MIRIVGVLVALVAAPQHDDLPPSHGVKPELYATGFEFAEGPALDAGGDLFVVNYRANGNIGRIAADGTAGVFCDLRKLVPLEGREVRANGLKIDSQGRLIASDSGAGRLLRIAAAGKNVEVLADRWEGKRFNGINDVALDLEGNIYFSDPSGSSPEKPIGAVYRYDIKTSKVSRLDAGLVYPNGLGVTPDQKHLCLSESAKHQMLIYDLTPQGTAVNRRVLIDFTKQTSADATSGKLVPDGLVFDAVGRLYVAIWSGGFVNVIEVPSGKLLRQYDAGGDHATNCHFHGDYLYTTVATKEAVFRLKLGVKGFDYSGAE